MVHIDEKYKDASPQATVEHIHELLKAQDIYLNEKWKDSGIPDCYSVHVTIAGTSLGTNGKGVTKELARASGCGEMMERLQSGFFCPGVIHYPDEVTMTKQELLKSSRSVLEKIAARISESEHIDFSVDKLLHCFYAFGTAETQTAIPFYNVNEDRLVYYPVSRISPLYASNGLAAGNSAEEAIVQGFSEIVERHCHGAFLLGEAVPPSIPDDYLKQFATAWNIISSLRSAGFNVMIKDCSLGEGYPVVASVVIDPERHGYHVVFGSSPVFEIALERSLTEQLQGYNIGTIPQNTQFFIGKTRSTQDLSHAFLKNQGTFPTAFFSGAPSYPFVPTEDLSNVTNRDLLRFILKYLEKNRRTMLIRDVSHFGFPAFRIIVPGMSEINTSVYAGEPSLYELIFRVGFAARNLPDATFEQLLAIPKRYLSTITNDPIKLTELVSLPMNASPTQDKFWGLITVAYSYWSLGNAAQSANYLAAALPFAPEESKSLADCLSRFLALRRSGNSKEQALAHLRLFYKDDTVRQLEDALKESNPFTVFLFRCFGNCADCENQSVCNFPAHDRITRQLNKAVAKFDAEKSFDALRACFSGCR